MRFHVYLDRPEGGLLNKLLHSANFTIFNSVKTVVTSWISRTYLTGVSMTLDWYERVSKDRTHTFTKSNSSMIEKLANGAWVTPPHGPSRVTFWVEEKMQMEILNLQSKSMVITAPV